MSDTTNLGKDLEDYIDGLVKSGRYETRDDVLKEGLRFLELRERRKRELDEALDRGLADAAAGRVQPIEDVAARLKAKYQAMRKERRA